MTVSAAALVENVKAALGDKVVSVTEAISYMQIHIGSDRAGYGWLRLAVQIVSYGIAMGFALVGVLMEAQSLNLVKIVQRQQGDFGLFNWFVVVWVHPPLCVWWRTP